MKIIIAHYKYYIQGGPERYLLKFTELAKKYGCEVIPFSINYEQNMETDYSKYFVQPAIETNGGILKGAKLTPKAIIKGTINEFHNKEAYDNLKKLIHDENPDVLYSLIPGELTADIFLAAKEAHLPTMMRLSDFRLLCGSNSLLRYDCVCNECIYGQYWHMLKYRCVHNSFAFSFLRMASLYYNRYSNAYKNVDAIIAPPMFTATKFIESGYFPKEKLYINPTFIETETIEPAYYNEGYVLCLGRFSIEKGFIYAIEAMKYLLDIDVKLVITGSEESCSSEVRNIINKYNLKSKVLFAGFLHGEDLKNLIKRAICIVCPAIWYENMPNVVLEAFAYGKPVIASNLGSLADMITDGENGYLFEPRNVEELAKRIRNLYSNPNLVKNMGMNARRKCETEYSPDRHWNNFIKIYNSII